jgi:Holliday junction resolvase RusA-like endonuclease
MSGGPIFETFIAMEPRGKGRHRTTREGRTYSDPKTVSAENLIKLKVGSEWRQAPLDEPLSVVVIAYMERPKSKPKRMLFPTGKPDWDNIGKLACDALNGILWRDDAVIVDGTTRKRYCHEGQPQPGISIHVWRA